MKPIQCSLILLAAAALALPASAQKGDKDSKSVTVITAESKADGSSSVTTERLKECLRSLPGVQALEPEMTSEVVYLREINGDAKDNRHVKVYSARLEVNYMLHQEDLIIVTTRSVQGQEPVFREVKRDLRQSRVFESNPANGDIFAGKSNSRRYYFSSAEAAAKDVKDRAQVWLQAQASVLCRD